VGVLDILCSIDVDYRNELIFRWLNNRCRRSDSSLNPKENIQKGIFLICNFNIFSFSEKYYFFCFFLRIGLFILMINWFLMIPRNLSLSTLTHLSLRCLFFCSISLLRNFRFLNIFFSAGSIHRCSRSGNFILGFILFLSRSCILSYCACILSIQRRELIFILLEWFRFFSSFFIWSRILSNECVLLLSIFIWAIVSLSLSASTLVTLIMLLVKLLFMISMLISSQIMAIILGISLTLLSHHHSLSLHHDVS